MYFEAEQKGKKYEITVNEDRGNWFVTLQQKDAESSKYIIPKSEYVKMDDAISFLFNKSSYVVDVVGSGMEYTVYTRGSYRKITIFNDEMLLHESLKKESGFMGSKSLTAGMPGKVVKVMIAEGQKVKKDDSLLIMEAMKMENEMRAVVDGVIKEVHVHDGDKVDAGATLITFE